MKHHNQVDYNSVKRFRSGVNIHNTKGFPEAGTRRDHDLVMMIFRVRLKKAKKPNLPRLRSDFIRLSVTYVAYTFQPKTSGKFAPQIGLKDEDTDINFMITTYSIAVTDAVIEVFRKECHRKKGVVIRGVLALYMMREEL